MCLALYCSPLGHSLFLLRDLVGTLHRSRAHTSEVCCEATSCASRSHLFRTCLRQVQRAELLGVGLLAGLLASIVASVVGWALAYYVFQFDWVVSLWVPLWGSLSGALLALAAGWWGLREVLRRPVVETLRRATSS